jgi:hypothetical protein
MNTLIDNLIVYLLAPVATIALGFLCASMIAQVLA